MYTSRGKLNTDRGLRLQAKLIASETTQQIGLSDARVTNEHDFEQVIIAEAQHTGLSSTGGQNNFALFEQGLLEEPGKTFPAVAGKKTAIAQHLDLKV